MSTTVRVALVAAAAALLAALAGPAAAHPAGDFYVAKWPGSAETYGYTPSVPSGWRGAIDNGATAWSKVKGATLDIVHGADHASNYTYSTCSSGKTGVHAANLGGPNGTLGVTYTCWSGSQITQSNVVFDTSENWYTGTGTPSGSQADLWSVATHEFGHSTGFGQGAPNGHFSGSICTSNSKQQTMCPSHTLGSTWQRSLATHDKHTFTAEY
jgi:hypothetical protein